MTKKKKCVKGFPCGNSCVRKSRRDGTPTRCSSNLSASGKKVRETYGQYLLRLTAEKVPDKIVEANEKEDVITGDARASSVENPEEGFDKFGRAIEQLDLPIGRFYRSVNKLVDEGRAGKIGVTLNYRPARQDYVMGIAVTDSDGELVDFVQSERFNQDADNIGRSDLRISGVVSKGNFSVPEEIKNLLKRDPF